MSKSSKSMDAHIPGRVGASPAVSGASPETCLEIHYSKRRLPHFERPWEKYAVVFSTYERRELTAAERDIVLASALHAYTRRQYELYVACVMPDHVHLLFEPQPKEQNEHGGTVFWSLSKILQGIKSSTAHRISKLRGQRARVWETESFDRYIRSERDLHEKFGYICRNPWQAGIVGPNENYPWLWTADMEVCSAVAPHSAGEAPALPRGPMIPGNVQPAVRI